MPIALKNIEKFMKIILASQSLFRKHALDILGLVYETIPSNSDESAIRHEDPHEMAKMLSHAKALKIGFSKNRRTKLKPKTC
jgi:predicted house-cleaning NTP pyrophosphatase (Maf/HAM1 superfamily)